MKTATQEPFSQNGFFALQNDDWLKKQRIAGNIAARTLNYLEKLIIGKTSHSLIELNDIAEKMITNAGAKPTFKGYRGFPAALCISVNEQLVHGIPSNNILKDGDIVSIDLGVTYDSAIADTALTCIYGTPKQSWHVKLINSTNEALEKGIASISVGKRLGVIGSAIYKSARGNGFSVITKYGGHGISMDNDGNGILHASPFISNKSSIDEGFRIQPGLVLALEPMLLNGVTDTYTASDGWTVYAQSVASHAEHTVYVHRDHVEITTDRKSL